MLPSAMMRFASQSSPTEISHLHEPALSSKSQGGVFTKMNTPHRYSGKSFSKADSGIADPNGLRLAALLSPCVY